MRVLVSAMGRLVLYVCYKRIAMKLRPISKDAMKFLRK